MTTKDCTWLTRRDECSDRFSVWWHEEMYSLDLIDLTVVPDSLGRNRRRNHGNDEAWLETIKSHRRRHNVSRRCSCTCRQQDIRTLRTDECPLRLTSWRKSCAYELGDDWPKAVTKCWTTCTWQKSISNVLQSFTIVTTVRDDMKILFLYLLTLYVITCQLLYVSVIRY